MADKVLVHSPPETERRGPFGRIMRGIEITEAVLGSLLLAVILVLVLIQVVLRFTPTAGWVWTGELAKFAMVWLAFILSGYLMGRDEHVTLDLIDHFLPERALRVMISVAQVITALICIAAFYEGYHLVSNQVNIRSPAAEIPMAIIYTVPMIGMGLTAVRCVVNAVTWRKP
ncbi:MAG TPA: TRAP transporter small permease subunit [Jiangellaceae bacterium]